MFHPYHGPGPVSDAGDTVVSTDAGPVSGEWRVQWRIWAMERDVSVMRVMKSGGVGILGACGRQPA